MSRLLATLLLTLGSASVLAAPDTTFKEWIRAANEDGLTTEPPALETAETVEGVIGGKFYIVDPNSPVEFTFVTSHAGHNLVFSVASVDDAGNVGNWQTVFTKTGDSVARTDYSIDPREFSYLGAIGNELVFRLDDTTTGNVYYSGTVDYYDNLDKTYLSDQDYHTVAYNDYYKGRTLVGIEDLSSRENSDWDYDDLVFLVSNVRQASHAPEPEAYAMLLAGLGLVGAVARRRRERV
ncbi:MAG: PEP-CTERM sorting domain-containing protein [Azoarcus sp.]|nr:PEP-CTERM sorting domain-containing protein [Azoarcus sp.]